MLRRISTKQASGLTDGELLERFVTQRDETAFEALLVRHGPMVLNTCRRLLGHCPDAEDAFQATFLVLCRKAGGITKRQSVGSWLYKVAYRVCLRTKATAARQPLGGEHLLEPADRERACALDWREVRSVLDEELNRLPEKYRSPLVLHYLEGKTVEQAAQELGWRHGTVCTRLARGKALLRTRLTRRGWRSPPRWSPASWPRTQGPRPCRPPSSAPPPVPRPSSPPVKPRPREPPPKRC
jgi:RNA polymerase sigma factor (sigma-70 family)